VQAPSLHTVDAGTVVSSTVVDSSVALATFTAEDRVVGCEVGEALGTTEETD
jgi:hypothetical protein